jgi:hypothetical protein
MNKIRNIILATFYFIITAILYKLFKHIIPNIKS